MNKTRFYVKCLAAELDRRKIKNPRYSLRAFAQQLGIDPSALSRILNGKQTLSLQSAVKVSQKMALPLDKKRQFLLSVADDQMDQVTSLLSGVIDLPLALVSSWKMEETGSPHPAGHEFLSFTSDRMTVMSRDGTYLYANPVAAATFSKLSGTPLTTQDLIGKNPNDLNFPEEISRVLREQDSAVFASGQPDVRVLSFQCGDGVFYLERGLSPIFGKNGEVAAVIGVGRDITARRKLEIERDRLLRFAKANQKIATALLPTLTRQQIVSKFFEVIPQEVGANSGSVYFASKESGQLTVLYGQSSSSVSSIPLNSKSLSAECIRTRQPIWVSKLDSQAMERFSFSAVFFKNKNAASAAALPLTINGDVFGVICLSFPVAHSFDHQEREFLITVGDQCAIALERARLFEERGPHDSAYLGIPETHRMEIEPF